MNQMKPCNQLLIVLAIVLLSLLPPHPVRAQTEGYLDYYIDCSVLAEYPTVTCVLHYYLNEDGIGPDDEGTIELICPKIPDNPFTYECLVPSLQDHLHVKIDSEGLSPLLIQGEVQFAGPKDQVINVISAVDSISGARLYSMDLNNDQLKLSVFPASSFDEYLAQTPVSVGYSKPYVLVYNPPFLFNAYKLRITVGMPGVYDLFGLRFDPNGLIRPT